MKLAVRLTRQVFLLGALLVATSIVSALAGAAPSARAANFSARLTKTSFTSSQAGSVKLVCKFSKKSGNFSYLLTLKKGKKWQTVKSVKKKGYRKGAYTTAVKKVFAGKAVKIGSYRLKLSVDGGRKQLSFKVVKAASPTVVTPPAGSKPVSTSPPLIIGTPTEGQTLTALNGSWNNSPTSYSSQWRSCDGSGSNCVDITSADSAQTAVVAGLPPANTALPAISGTTTQGQTLTAANGTWTNSPTGHTYQWRRCDSTGNSCTDIADATGSAYVPVYEDAGGTTRVIVTASNPYGTSNATSAPTAVVTGLPPSNIGPIPPAISGTTTQGNQLTAAPGLWRNSPTSFSYLWRRCNSSGSSCADIGVASPLNTYMLVADDVGYRIRVEVTASNPWGSNSNTSAATAVVQGAPPVNTVLPAISGEALPVIGHTLTASNGSWNPAATSYTYQWQHCHYSGSPCTDISGEILSTYVLQASDYGQKIQVVVTAHNAYGVGNATSAQTGLVGRPPLNTGLPTISGMAREGQTLTASTGSWTESPTSYSYQWRICDGTGSGCFDAGTDASTFSLAIRDIVGATIRVVVTATNAYGSGGATSVQTAVVDTGAPINTALPTITGSPGVGQTLTASNGSWNPAATLPYSYEWQHCTVVGGVCTSISGAYLGTYVPQAADIGYTIRVIVTAWNDYGSGGATSAKTGIIGSPPVNTAPPSISGTAQVGQTLSASAGSWNPAATSYSYQWRRCDSSGSSCVDIGTGGPGSTYLLQDADYQHTIRVIVTASNTYGGNSATSAQTAVVVGNPPVNYNLPAIYGSAKRGEIVHALTGDWYNSPTSYWYDWYRCDSAGNNCVDTGFDSENYIVQAADVGGTIRVLVTAYNTYGPGTAVFSAAFGPVVA